jgi:hypothetical protein
MSDTITLLSYPQRTILIYAENYSGTINMPFNITRKTIYKGVDNKLTFDIKNQDRKPVNLLSNTVWINIINTRTGLVLLQRRTDLTNPSAGECSLTIYSSDLVDIDPGIYQLSAVFYDQQGLSKPLYADNNRKVTVELEIADGIYPGFRPSIPLVFSVLNNSNIPGQPTQYISQALPGNLQRHTNSTLNTIQITVTNYKGTVGALASMDYDSGGNYFPTKFVNDAYDIIFRPPYGAVATYDRWPDGDVEGWNFMVSARWIKIIYTPDPDNTGTVDKILYRV